MKKIIKFIAIVFVIVLSMTAFIGCDSSTSYTPQEISLFEYTENKEKLVKKYDLDNYDLIEDFSVYNTFTSKHIIEQEIVDTDSEQPDQSIVVNTYTGRGSDNSLQVKRIGEDVFFTASFIDEEENNSFHFIKGELVEYKYFSGQKYIYQTGKDNYGYYIISNEEFYASALGQISYNITPYFYYFNDREEYKSFVCEYLRNGFIVDNVYYYDSNYTLTKAGEDIELNAMKNWWSDSYNSNYYKEKSTYNVKYNLNGIYSQSTYVMEGKDVGIENRKTVSVIDYSAEYERIELDFNEYSENRHLYLETNVLENSHVF